MKAVVTVMALCVFVLVGCRRGDIATNRSEGTVTVTLTAAEVNEMVAATLDALPTPLLRTPTIALRDGALVVNGEHDRRNGSGERISGSVSLVPAVTNGMFSLTVSAVDIEGIPVNDDGVQLLATRLADRINTALQRTSRVFSLDAVTVSDNQLEIVLRRGE